MPRPTLSALGMLGRWSPLGSDSPSQRGIRSPGAARTLFRERGYVSTTVAAITKGSGIPVQTLYSAFGTKSNTCQEITRDWMADSETTGPPPTRSPSPDPANRLRLFTRMQHQQIEV